jgi:hypothetical protein
VPEKEGSQRKRWAAQATMIHALMPLLPPPEDPWGDLAEPASVTDLVSARDVLKGITSAITSATDAVRAAYDALSAKFDAIQVPLAGAPLTASSGAFSEVIHLESGARIHVDLKWDATFMEVAWRVVPSQSAPLILAFEDELDAPLLVIPVQPAEPMGRRRLGTSELGFDPTDQYWQLRVLNLS